MHFHLICGHACESTWLKTVLFLLLQAGVCIDVYFILAYVTLGSYVSHVSTHYTLATVY